MCSARCAAVAGARPARSRWSAAQIRGIVYDDDARRRLPTRRDAAQRRHRLHANGDAANEDGAYIFAQVPPGPTRSRPSSAASRPRPSATAGVNVGPQLTSDITMAVAGQKEVVTVGRGRRGHRHVRRRMSQLINAEAVANLPLPGRDFAIWRSSAPRPRSYPASAAASGWAASRATTPGSSSTAPTPTTTSSASSSAPWRPRTSPSRSTRCRSSRSSPTASRPSSGAPRAACSTW